MARTRHNERDARRTGRAETRQTRAQTFTAAEEEQRRADARAELHAAEMARAAARSVDARDKSLVLETVRLSYSSEPSSILFGPDAGKLARVGLDAHGRFVIVPVER